MPLTTLQKIKGKIAELNTLLHALDPDVIVQYTAPAATENETVHQS